MAETYFYSQMTDKIQCVGSCNALLLKSRSKAIPVKGRGSIGM
jgi:hypothetical protein